VLSIPNGSGPWSAAGGGVDKFRINETVPDKQMSAVDGADRTTVLSGGSIVSHK